MQPATLINLPDASTTLSSLSNYSAPVFTTLLPIQFVLVGLAVGGLLVYFFGHAIISGIATAIHGRHPGSRYDHMV